MPRRRAGIARGIARRVNGAAVLAAVVWVLAVPAGRSPGQPADPAPPTPPEQRNATTADDVRIEALIHKLGDPSYEVRTQATRELCRIGHRAAAALKQAAASDEFEIALRAANLLEVIDSVYFGGCSVRLSADPHRIAWDRPVELTVTIRNESDYPAQIPVETSARRRDELSPDARQVGDMVDLADYLRVVSPDGRRVDLEVDDILVDPQVTEAIEWRVDGGPLSELAPGGEAVVRVSDFNRGWARYPLLTRGVHKIVFVYEPQWDDQEFRRAGVGRVEGNAVEVEVTEPAPPIVRRRLPPAVVSIERAGDEMVARLTNSDDLPIWVNTNWGSNQPPFTEIIWTVFVETSSQEERLAEPGRAPPMNAFSRQRLVEVAPGASTELGRTPIERLLETATARGLPAGQSFQVRAALVNLCDLPWQRRQEPALLGNPRAPAGLQTPLPRRMITGRFPSDPVELAKPAPQAGSAP